MSQPEILEYKDTRGITHHMITVNGAEVLIGPEGFSLDHEEPVRFFSWGQYEDVLQALAEARRFAGVGE